MNYLPISKNNGQTIEVKDHFWFLFFSPFINGALAGFALGLVVAALGQWFGTPDWEGVRYFLAVGIVLLVLIIWFLLFFKKGTGMINYSRNKKIPDPYMTGFSFGYFIVFI